MCMIIPAIVQTRKLHQMRVTTCILIFGNIQLIVNHVVPFYSVMSAIVNNYSTVLFSSTSYSGVIQTFCVIFVHFDALMSKL